MNTEAKKINNNFELANNLVQKGSYSDAIKYYKKLLEENKNDIELLYKLALVYFYSEKASLVQNTLERLLTIDSRYDKAYYLLAKNYFLFKNKKHEAVKSILKAIELNQSDSFYYSLAANVFYSLGNYKRASKLINDSLEINPNNYEAHLLLSDEAYKDNNTVKALDHYKIALETGPEAEDLYYNLSVFHLKLAQKKLGLKLIKEVFAQKPHDKVLKWLFTYSYMRNNPFNKPFLWIDNVYLNKKQLGVFLISLLIIIGAMYISQDFCIYSMEVFKWACSIIFILFIPYQLVVFTLLNLYFYLAVLPRFRLIN